MKRFFPAAFLLFAVSLAAGNAVPDPVAEFRGETIPKSALGDDLEKLNALSPEDRTGLSVALRRAVEKYCGNILLEELLSRPSGEAPRATAQRYIDEQSLGNDTAEKLQRQIDDPDFQRKAKIHYILRERYGDDALTVTEEDIQLYYRSHPEQFRLPENLLLGIISFADIASAQAAHDRLMQGANFDRVAMECDPNSERHQPTPEEGSALREIAGKMQVNDLSGIIRYGDRFFLIKLKSREPSRFRPLAEVHDVLKEELLGIREAEFLQKLLAEEIDRGGLSVRDPASF
ncbi:MAG: peptidyl-prolyl cis-trans isomerase [Victivallaceae bacterium]|nr:peptidyl-prolyl cis-trans isomerase [Victivallaceae bacterium]